MSKAVMKTLRRPVLSHKLDSSIPVSSLTKDTMQPLARLVDIENTRPRVPNAEAPCGL
jgi:hypothetical protein